MNNIKDQENLNQKIVLLRLDLNVPLKDGKITETSSSITKPTSKKFIEVLDRLIKS